MSVPLKPNIEDFFSAVREMEHEYESRNNESQAYYVCPFCCERDFDLEGLKTHLSVYCEVHPETEHID